MTDDPQHAALDPIDGPEPAPPLNFRKRLEELGQMALLIFILASAAFLSAITAMRIAIHGREVTIVRQTPPAGLLMKESQQVHVVLSLGQRQLRIPLLEGNSLRASRIELLRAGLQVGEVSAVTMTDKPADEVVIQTPRPGNGAATPRVDVLVSQGQRESAYVMPHFVGMTESDAQRRFDIAGLRRKVNYVTAPQWPHATVIDQSPLAGSRLPAASTIELTVAN